MPSSRFPEIFLNLDTLFVIWQLLIFGRTVVGLIFQQCSSWAAECRKVAPSAFFSGQATQQFITLNLPPCCPQRRHSPGGTVPMAAQPRTEIVLANALCRYRRQRVPGNMIFSRSDAASQILFLYIGKMQKYQVNA